jgi:preprotein translocase subunit SecY
MLAQLANIFRAPDLRKKVLYTLMMVTIIRLTAFVPSPFVDPDNLKVFMQRSMAGGGVLSFVNMFTGNAFRQMTIGALGIMPYISASIILQLLMVVWPRLEKIAKEGEAGRKKINQYTRYGTVVLAAFQGLGIAFMMISSNPCARSITRFSSPSSR